MVIFLKRDFIALIAMAKERMVDISERRVERIEGHILELKESMTRMNTMMEAHVKQAADHLTLSRENQARINKIEKDHVKVSGIVMGVGMMTGVLSAFISKVLNI